MKTSLKALTLASCLMLVWGAHGAPGDVDLTFDAGSTLNNSPSAIAVQSDSKIIIGGSFTTVAGLMRNHIARLNPDGTGDNNFNPGTGANGHVTSLVLQPDGKVLVGGGFTEFNGVARNRIARLNGDGTLDASFDPGTGADGSIFSVVLQPDGKVLLAGYFTHVNGTSRNHIARLNADGTLDTSFNPGSGPDGYVYSIVLQPDGRMIIGGLFGTVNGVNRSRIARLNANGSVDTSFDPGTGPNGYVFAVALQSDGRALVGGYFFNVNGTIRNCIARLNVDGSLDETFNPGAGTSEIIAQITLQPDGKVLVAGQFRYFNGTSRNYLARLNANGSLDTNFNPAMVAYPPGVVCLGLQADGKLLVSGGLERVDGRSRIGFARLNADGTLDTQFNPCTGISGYSVFSLVSQPDGKALVAGNFSEMQNRSRAGIGRLNADGSLDESFDPGPILNVAFYSISNPVVYSIALQPDGKVLVGGGFTNINGTSRNNIMRLNADGSVDASFNPGTGADYNVYKLALQLDGKVLIAGGFESVNGVSRKYFARLHSNGSLDASFNPNLGNGFPSTIAVQEDGKILVGGYSFTNQIIRHFVIRLNADGTHDNSFNTGAGPNNWLSSLTVQLDGKIIVAGSFTTFNGTTRSHIARLNSNGSLDDSFDPSIGPSAGVGPVALQRNGKMLIGVGFTNVNGTPRGGIARLNTDGSLDVSFNPLSRVDNGVGAIALQPRNRILIGGDFSSVNGVARGKVARLFAGGTLIPRIVTSPRVEFAGVTGLFVISPNNTNALVVLDGSQSSGAENDPLQYSWIEGTNTFATGARATNLFELGVHTVSLIVDDGASTGTETVTFEVIKPSKAVGILIALVEESELPRRIQRQLVARLELASALFDRGHFRVGIQLLRALQHRVRAQVSPRDPVLAADLIDDAQEIINALAVTAAPATGGSHGRINMLARQPNGQTRLKISVAPGHDYVIEASTNLLDWEVIGIYKDNGKDSFDFDDVEADQFPARFYRIVAP